MNETTSLIPIENVNPMELFQEGGLDPLLDRIESEVNKHRANLEFDVETPAGRKLIGNIARKVSSSKVVIDNAGKELVSGWKEKAKVVDAARRHARERLDALRDDINAPLNAWKEEQAAIKAEEKRQEEIAAVWELAHQENQLFDQARELREREKAIKAAEDAQRQAERDAQVRRDAEEAERRRIEDAKRREAEEAAAQERRKREEEERRAADREHRRTINAGIVEALGKGGVDEGAARKVVSLVASGMVPGMSIRY